MLKTNCDSCGQPLQRERGPHPDRCQGMMTLKNIQGDLATLCFYRVPNGLVGHVLLDHLMWFEQERVLKGHCQALDEAILMAQLEDMMTADLFASWDVSYLVGHYWMPGQLPERVKALTLVGEPGDKGHLRVIDLEVNEGIHSQIVVLSQPLFPPLR